MCRIKKLYNQIPLNSVQGNLRNVVYFVYLLRKRQLYVLLFICSNVILNQKKLQWHSIPWIFTDALRSSGACTVERKQQHFNNFFLPY